MGTSPRKKGETIRKITETIYPITAAMSDAFIPIAFMAMYRWEIPTSSITIETKTVYKKLRR